MTLIIKVDDNDFDNSVPLIIKVDDTDKHGGASGSNRGNMGGHFCLLRIPRDIDIVQWDINMVPRDIDRYSTTRYRYSAMRFEYIQEI